MSWRDEAHRTTSEHKSCANSKFKNDARFRRAKTKFFDRRGRPFALLSLQKRSAGQDLPTRGNSQAIIRTGSKSSACPSGMTIMDAAKKLLAHRRQPLRNPDLGAAFQAGGLVMTSALSGPS